MNKVVMIVGPTAVGKTALSIELAKRFNGEIISADSVQIYKKLDVGSAKVTKEEGETMLKVFVSKEFKELILAMTKDADSDVELAFCEKEVKVSCGGTNIQLMQLVQNTAISSILFSLVTIS